MLQIVSYRSRSGNRIMAQALIHQACPSAWAYELQIWSGRPAERTRLYCRRTGGAGDCAERCQIGQTICNRTNLFSAFNRDRMFFDGVSAIGTGTEAAY